MCFQVTELAGYVSRVYNMFHVFDDVSKGCYVRSSEVKDIDPELIRIAGGYFQTICKISGVLINAPDIGSSLNNFTVGKLRLNLYRRKSITYSLT